MQFAVIHGQTKTIELLLQLNIDPSIVDNRGDSPLQFAIKHIKEIKTITMLLQNSKEVITVDTFKAVLVSKRSDILHHILDKTTEIQTIINLKETAISVLEKAYLQEKYPSNPMYKGVFKFLLENMITSKILAEHNWKLDICAKFGLTSALQ